MGTYIHGILDNAPVIEHLLAPFSERLSGAAQPFDYQAYKEQQYDRLAAHVRRYVDVDKIYKILTDD